MISVPVRLLITTVINLGLLVASSGMIVILPMMFDAPGSQKKRSLRLMAAGIIAIPVFLLVCTVTSWIAYFAQNDDLAMLLGHLPLGIIIGAAILGVPLVFFGGLIGGILSGGDSAPDDPVPDSETD